MTYKHELEESEYRMARACLSIMIFVGVCLLWMWCPGCMAPVTVNVFSSRMAVAYGTNTITQEIEGGANVSSNTTSATIPLK